MKAFVSAGRSFGRFMTQLEGSGSALKCLIFVGLWLAPDMSQALGEGMGQSCARLDSNAELDACPVGTRCSQYD